MSLDSERRDGALSDCGLSDSHCHLDDPRIAADAGRLVAEARAVGVRRILVPGVCAARWPVQQGLCRAHRLDAAYGVHPWFIEGREAEAALSGLAELLAQPECLAVGECGLDFWPDMAPQALQYELLERQLALAREHDLPVVLHARKSYDQLARRLADQSPPGAVLHGFAGSAQQACRLLDLGCYLGVGGLITRASAGRLRQLLRLAPLDRLLLETDAPDQTPGARRGQLNRPAFLPDIADCLAGLLGISRQRMACVSGENYARLFRRAAD
jgi:TatD DNase family protein